MNPAIEKINTHEFRNSLGILSTKDHFKFKPKRLLEITGYSKTALAKESHSSRPLWYRDEVDLRSMKKLREGVLQLVMASDLAFELFKYNDQEAKDLDINSLSASVTTKLRGETERWMVTPNQLLFGKSPFEVCISANGVELIKWLAAKLGKTELMNLE
jgi:hypothetical protein